MRFQPSWKMRTRRLVMAQKVRRLSQASHANLPQIMYCPVRMKGIPQSDMNQVTGWDFALVSQMLPRKLRRNLDTAEGQARDFGGKLITGGLAKVLTLLRRSAKRKQRQGRQEKSMAEKLRGGPHKRERVGCILGGLGSGVNSGTSRPLDGCAQKWESTSPSASLGAGRNACATKNSLGWCGRMEV